MKELKFNSSTFMKHSWITGGGVSVKRVFKLMLKALNVTFSDNCCEPGNEVPVQYNISEATAEYYDPTTKEYVAFGGGGGGSSAFAYREITAPTTIVLGTDGIVNATAGTFTQPLPLSDGTNIGVTFNFKNIGAGVITLDGSGAQPIDSDLTLLVNPTENYQLLSTGSGYIKL